jgi:hypothetical protein
MKKLGSGGQGAVYLVDILSAPFTSAPDTDREATACDQVYGKKRRRDSTGNGHTNEASKTVPMILPTRNFQQNFQWQMNYFECSNAGNLANLIAAFHQEAKSSQKFHLACIQAPC